MEVKLLIEGDIKDEGHLRKAIKEVLYAGFADHFCLIRAEASVETYDRILDFAATEVKDETVFHYGGYKILVSANRKIREGVVFHKPTANPE